MRVKLLEANYGGTYYVEVNSTRRGTAPYEKKFSDFNSAFSFAKKGGNSKTIIYIWDIPKEERTSNSVPNAVYNFDSGWQIIRPVNVNEAIDGWDNRTGIIKRIDKYLSNNSEAIPPEGYIKRRTKEYDSAASVYGDYVTTPFVNIKTDDLMSYAREHKLLEKASYGGAFDIATDEYFTRDDINSAAEEVLNHINETFYDEYVIGGTWFEDGNWIVNIQPEDGRLEFENSIKIDMRKIRNPLDLKRKYALELAAKIIADIKEYQAEETQALSESKDDFKVDDEVYVIVSNRRGIVTKVFGDKVEVEMPAIGKYPARTDVFYKEDVEHLNVKNSIRHNWEKVASKSVYDSDGFLTDYTWYRDLNSDLHIFMLGDNDIYEPDMNYADFSTENMKEAEDWYDSYEGFVDDEDDDLYEVDYNLFESVMHPDCKVKQFDDKVEAYEFARECKGSIESVIDDNHNWQHYVFYKDCITEEITADDEPVHISSSIEDLNAFCRGLGDACKHLNTEGDCCNYRGYVVEFTDDNYYVYLEEA